MMRAKRAKQKRQATDKLTPSLIAYTQIYFMQQVMTLAAGRSAEKEKEAGVLAMFHALALIFHMLNASVLAGAPRQRALRIKGELVEHFARAAFGLSRELTEEECRRFTGWVMDLYEALGLLESTPHEQAAQRVCDSLCEQLALKQNEQALRRTFLTFDQKVCRVGKKLFA